MKISKTKMLVAGLLMGSLTFMGCKSNQGAERTDDTTQGTGTGTEGTGTGTGTEGTGTGTGTGMEGTGTGTDTGGGTGGAGTTDDPGTGTDMGGTGTDMGGTGTDTGGAGTGTTGESEFEPGVHDDPTLDPGSGTGGSGVGTGVNDDIPNESGNIGDGHRMPDMPADPATPEDRMLDDDLDTPEGAR